MLLTLQPSDWTLIAMIVAAFVLMIGLVKDYLPIALVGLALFCALSLSTVTLQEKEDIAPTQQSILMELRNTWGHPFEVDGSYKAVNQVKVYSEGKAWLVKRDTDRQKLVFEQM